MATIKLVASITSATVHGSVDPQAVFCARYNCGFSVDIVGTGFFAGTTMFLQDLITTTNSATSVIDSSHAATTFLVGSRDFGPESWHIGVQDSGLCCNSEADASLVFLGNLDTLDISATDAYQLDQLATTNPVKKFKLADESLDTSFNFNLDGHSQTIAVDDKTGDFILVQIAGMGFDVFDANGVIVGGGWDSQRSLAVSAKGGYMCGSEDVAGQIVSQPLPFNGPPFGTLIVGSNPWQTAMLTLNNQLVCTVFNVGDLKFTVAPIPIPSVNPAPLWTLTVTGLTPLSQIPDVVAAGGYNFAPNGGWPLVASQLAQKVALLSRFDRKVVIFDLLAKTQTHTVDLTPNIGGNVILAMGVDDAHQKAVISLGHIPPPDFLAVNFPPESSTFISVDLATGTVSPMSATVPFYAFGLRVSHDGTTLYVGGFVRDPVTDAIIPKFLEVPNQ